MKPVLSAPGYHLKKKLRLAPPDSVLSLPPPCLLNCLYVLIIYIQTYTP